MALKVSLLACILAVSKSAMVCSTVKLADSHINKLLAQNNLKQSDQRWAISDESMLFRSFSSAEPKPKIAVLIRQNLAVETEYLKAIENIDKDKTVEPYIELVLNKACFKDKEHFYSFFAFTDWVNDVFEFATLESFDELFKGMKELKMTMQVKGSAIKAYNKIIKALFATLKTIDQNELLLKIEKFVNLIINDFFIFTARNIIRVNKQWTSGDIQAAKNLVSSLEKMYDRVLKGEKKLIGITAEKGISFEVGSNNLIELLEKAKTSDDIFA